MGGSSSQRHTNSTMSPINAFLVENLYTPEFLKSLQENTSYWQEPNPHEYPVEQVATSPPKMKKLTRNCQKRTIQSDDAPRQTVRTTKKEIVLAQGWLAISKNSKNGITRKEHGFWCEFCGVYANVMLMAHESREEDYIQRAMIHYQIETRLHFKLY
ncbi:hypothetical protein Tco_1423410 [Tanacetum coccineum]